MRIPTTIALAAMLSGCYSIGNRDITESDITTKVVNGETAKDKVSELLRQVDVGLLRERGPSRMALLLHDNNPVIPSVDSRPWLVRGSRHRASHLHVAIRRKRCREGCPCRGSQEERRPSGSRTCEVEAAATTERQRPTQESDSGDRSARRFEGLPGVGSSTREPRSPFSREKRSRPGFHAR